MPWKPKQFHVSGKTRIERRRDFDRTKRPAWHGWYSTEPWLSIRRAWLSRNPMCAYCTKEGREHFGTHVDHEPPHNGEWAAFVDESRFQTLCERHHNQKTARQTKFGK
jgi:5-methylcytosine-specific restriction protein A